MLGPRPRTLDPALTQAAAPLLTIAGVRKEYQPGLSVLRGIDLSVDAGEIVCLLGPSGCGKTTLLRIVAGLEQAEQGQVCFQGRILADIPVHQRGFGLMFQEFALFPHKTVGENVAFGLRMAGHSARDIEQRVREMLDLVSLGGYAERSIFELSGGERQRVALARSLAPNPSLLMLDEPLGSLDRTLRESLMNELRLILKQVGVTALYVTHDQQEAFALADRVVLMNQGRIEQEGRPEEVYYQPATIFVARFLGLSNLVPAQVQPQEPEVALTALGRFRLPRPASPGTYTLLIRPETMNLAGEGGDAAGSLSGTLRTCSFRGSYYRIEVLLAGEDGASDLGLPEPRFAFDLPSRQWQRLHASLPATGQPIQLDIEREQVWLLAA